MSADQDLWDACRAGDLAGVQSALLAGADVAAEDPSSQNMTALAIAAVSSAPTTVVNELLGASASVNAQDADGATPIMRALQSSSAAIATILSTVVGADSSLADSDGLNALHYVAGVPSASTIVPDLVASGAQLDLQEPLRYKTPMMFAADWGSTAVVQALIDAGASPTLKDISGETAMTIARRRGFSSLGGLLFSAIDGETANKWFVAHESQTTGIAGGDFASGSWVTRALNTVVKSADFAGLASSQITLAVGTYRAIASASAYRVGNHQIRLRDTTGNSTLQVGTSAYSPSNNLGTATASEIDTVFTLSVQSVIEVQHRCSVGHTVDGFGTPSAFGESEVYATVRIHKIG